MRVLFFKVVLFVLCLFILGLHQSQAAKADDKNSEHKSASRIISLYSAHTENLVSLGAEGQLIGISQSDNYPEKILEKPRFSYRDDPERFIAVQPDLVLVRPMIERSYPQLISKLRQAGISVVSLQPNSVDEIYAYWQELGRLTGRSVQADEMVRSFKSGLEEAKVFLDEIPHSERPRVYFESMHVKMKTFAQKSIAIFVLEQAGGINVAKDAMQVRTTNIAAYSKERILAHAQDIDVYLAQKGRMNPVSLKMIKEEPGFQAIKAVQKGKIYLIDEQLVSRPTIRILEGVRHLNGLLYPRQIAKNAKVRFHEKR